VGDANRRLVGDVVAARQHVDREVAAYGQRLRTRRHEVALHDAGQRCEDPDASATSEIARQFASATLALSSFVLANVADTVISVPPMAVLTSVGLSSSLSSGTSAIEGRADGCDVLELPQAIGRTHTPARTSAAVSRRHESGEPLTAVLRFAG